MNLNERTLVIAAHPDDEVLGCGATMARTVAQGGYVQSVFLADGESSRFSPAERESKQVLNKIDSRRTAANKAAMILGSLTPRFYDFPDNQLDTVSLLALAKVIEAEIELFRPTRVITHHSTDLNIDHQMVHEAVLVATRPVNNSPVTEILFFELPSSTEWRPPTSGAHFAPNLFVEVTDFVEKKFQALGAYEVEMRTFPHPRSLEALEALMRWRGASSGLHAAESFVIGRSRCL